MKRVLLSLMLILSAASGTLFAQNCYWVFLADKHGSTFDPYSYFSDKAVERYRQCGADLYDISNYPINSDYERQIGAIVHEEVGQSRWLNAIAVMATPSEVERIEALPFVKRVQMIAVGQQMAQYESVPPQSIESESDEATNESIWMTNQLIRMGGADFYQQGIDGHGIRIAVLDGGFPSVNTHPAFKHLRDNNRIIDTWNFPNKKANVYGWNSHGTMTLSCVTGRLDNLMIGLATGAEFLLYRTEVNLEPFKEEVWWMMGMERADKYGANIISSSLGYGKDRHYTQDMDGSSYVAKAATLAARKGILVCNSAGNEGEDRSWRTIITPSDADSVLCVGGIEADLHSYQHISFSSYGPSADGRLKPEVCAFGHAVVADPGSDTTTEAYGTSFSCPLTAGFAACAWQTHPEMTAMELKEAIERSADRYPYFDYALGYGVPQASYFLEEEHTAKEPTFMFFDTLDYVFVIPLDTYAKSTLCFNKQHNDGTLEKYYSYEMYGLSPESVIYFEKSALGDCTLNVWLEGFTGSYKNPVSTLSEPPLPFKPNFGTSTNEGISRSMAHDRQSTRTSRWGNNSPWRYDLYWEFGSMVNSHEDETTLSGFSPVNHIGLRIMRGFSKSYSLGVALEWGMANHHLLKDQINPLDAITIGMNGNGSRLDKKYLKNGMVGIELFQRIRFVAGGSIAHRGIFWDLGIFGNWNYYSYRIGEKGNAYTSSTQHHYNNPKMDDLNRWNWGVSTRIGYDIFSIYARYRLTHIGNSATQPDDPSSTKFNLPRLEIGLELMF